MIRLGEVHMIDPPTGLFSVEFLPSYGFISPGRGTTNGDLRLLVAYNPASKDKILDFAEYADTSGRWQNAITKLRGTKT